MLIEVLLNLDFLNCIMKVIVFFSLFLPSNVSFLMVGKCVFLQLYVKKKFGSIRLVSLNQSLMMITLVSLEVKILTFLFLIAIFGLVYRIMQLMQ